MRPRHFVITVVVIAMLALVMTGCGKSKKEEPVKETETEEQPMSSTPSSTPGSTPQPAAQLGPDGKPVRTLASFTDGQDGANVEAVLKTGKGDIVIQLYPDVAPVSVASFLHLARTKFYDGTRFHRVVPGFVVQGGDPKSKKANAPDVGTGGPGYYLPSEFSNRPHETGTVAMARSQSPTSGGSQFYICLEPQPSLDGQYTVFGKVISGMDVVNSIVQGDVLNQVIIRPKTAT